MKRAGSAVSAPAGYHVVRSDENDRTLARIVAEFLHKGFRCANPGVVIVTAELRDGIVRNLVTRGLDVVALQRSQNLLLLDARETLAAFMMDRRPDASKFNAEMSQVIRRACRDRVDCTVRIFGQMIDVLRQDGHRDAANRLEVLWKQMAETKAFSVWCAYAIGDFYAGPDRDDIGRQHSDHVPADGEANQVG